MVHNSRNTFAEIDLAALRQNIRELKARHGGGFFCPMVKADGYGHGDLEIAREIENLKVSAVGVVTIEEGLRLRSGGVRMPILVFGASDCSFLDEALRARLTPVLSRWDQVETLMRKKTVSSVHLKFNTGMARLGFSVEDAGRLRSELKGKLKVEGICTHFVNGEDANRGDGLTFEQLRKFSLVENEFAEDEVVPHYINSSALLAGLTVPSECKMTFSKRAGVRPGITIYGVNPLSTASPIPLKPIMRIWSRIELTQKIKAGQTVSYGGTWEAQHDSFIGVVPIGYADGYPRALSNKSEMWVAGERVPVRGIVCMDYCMVDLSQHPQKEKIAVGEKVLVFGQIPETTIPVEDLGRLSGSISYEILTKIGARVTRVYVNGSSQ